MKKVTLPAVVLTLTLVQGSAADAGSHRRHVRTYNHYGMAHRYRNDDTIGGYYEHRLDAVRFGSQRWWYIYDQQHGGRRR
jgi:hypothetical protein